MKIWSLKKFGRGAKDVFLFKFNLRVRAPISCVVADTIGAYYTLMLEQSSGVPMPKAVFLRSQTSALAQESEDMSYLLVYSHTILSLHWTS
jgi:hypothetical protein